MGRDLGQVTPPSHGSSWSWPFGSMEAGDYFVVDQLDKPKGAVANIVRVSAHRMGKQFSITEHPEQPGMTLVTCKDWSEQQPVKAVQRPVASPAEFWKLMERCAGLNSNSVELDFWGQSHWEREIAWYNLPAVRVHTVTMYGGDQYRFTFTDKSLVAEYLGNINGSMLVPKEPARDDWYEFLARDKAGKAKRDLLAD